MRMQKGQLLRHGRMWQWLPRGRSGLRLVLAALSLGQCLFARAQDGYGYGRVLQGGATFYGDASGAGTWGGNCGYGNLIDAGYGPYIAAGSAPLYKGGEGCGACYEIKCINSQYCTGESLVVPITDFCPGGNWCCPTCNHFDLSQPAFAKIANIVAGAVDLQYQRVPCIRSGTIRLIVTGGPYWMNLLVENVAGPGDVESMSVASGGGSTFLLMYRSWGSNFVYNGFLQAPLQFRVTSHLGEQTVQTPRACLPANWQPGTYYCNIQFSSNSSSSTASPPPPRHPLAHHPPPPHHPPPHHPPPLYHSPIHHHPPPLHHPPPPKVGAHGHHKRKKHRKHRKRRQHGVLRP